MMETIVIGASVAVFIVFCGVAVMGTCFICLKKKRQNRSSASIREFIPREGPKSLEILTQARPFKLTEIKNATQNFKKKVGEGGFGPVYYGQLAEGPHVAVKVQAGDSNQGAHEFCNEVQMLSRAHHRNVVSLLGYCDESKSRMLVYEYLPGGTLEQHIHASGISSKPTLTWKMRLILALDAAKGIEYLHNGCSPPIIHRDVKSGNILLTEKLAAAKVADFGLSRLGPESGASRVFTIVKGTSGYVDPEYYESQQLTQKSDVYSFGVVLLEILSGKEALIDEPPRMNWKLCDWARRLLLDRRIESVIDPVLHGCYNIEAAWKVAELAMFCVEPRSVHRPTMGEVIQDLKEAIDIEDGKVIVSASGRSEQTHSDSLRGIKTNKKQKQSKYDRRLSG